METKILKEKSCIYLIPSLPVFNKEDYSLFENFSEEFSWQLFHALYLNYFEIFELLPKYNAVFVLPTKDKEHIPEYIGSNGYSIYFTDTLDYETVIAKLNEKFFNGYTGNLVVFAESIGVTPKNIETVFNLLNNEDNYIVAGRTVNEQLSFIGFNSFEERIKKLHHANGTTFDEMLKNLCSINSNIHIIKGGQVIKNLDDFKLLYKILSSKESFAFCNQKIHELFTNIFIEYKDLL